MSCLRVCIKFKLNREEYFFMFDIYLNPRKIYKSLKFEMICSDESKYLNILDVALGLVTNARVQNYLDLYELKKNLFDITISINLI